MSFRVCRTLSQYSAFKFRKLLSPVSCSNRRSGDGRCYSTVKLNNISELIDCPLLHDEFAPEDSSYMNVNEEAITGNDPEKLKALRVLQVQLTNMKQEGKKIPSHIDVGSWKMLLNFKDEVRKTSFLGTLWYMETKKKCTKLQKEESKKIREKMQEEKLKSEPVKSLNRVQYGLKHTTLFYSIKNKQIYRFYEYKLLLANWFGPHILIDCGYESLMDAKCLSTCAKHLILMWANNREHPHPFNLIFCNVNKNGSLVELLRRKLIRFDVDYLPLDIRSEHYTDIFPKEKLVYLTADCSETLNQYNPDDVYIIGGLVDSPRCEKLSMERAGREGIRKAKLPFTYLPVSSRGNRKVTLLMKDVLAIMTAVKCGIDWSQTLSYYMSRSEQSSELPDDDDFDENFDTQCDSDSDEGSVRS